jgi:hypothetical protein
MNFIIVQTSTKPPTLVLTLNSSMGIVEGCKRIVNCRDPVELSAEFGKSQIRDSIDNIRDCRHNLKDSPRENPLFALPHRFGLPNWAERQLAMEGRVFAEPAISP